MAMIKVHQRLEDLTSARSRSAAGDGSSSDRQMWADLSDPSLPITTTSIAAVLPGASFRNKRSFPGGAIYKSLDDVRLVLQVNAYSYVICI